MQPIKQAYIDGYKVTTWEAKNEHIISLEFEDTRIWKDGLTKQGADFLLFQYIKDGVQIANEFKNE